MKAGRTRASAETAAVRDETSAAERTSSDMVYTATAGAKRSEASESGRRKGRRGEARRKAVMRWEGGRVCGRSGSRDQAQSCYQTDPQ